MCIVITCIYVYINEKVTKYNNTYHRTIKMKPVDVMPSMHMQFD